MKPSNRHESRESWLKSATSELKPYFEKIGYKIPESIRFAIAFTSGGKRGKIAGECWHPSASDDGHHEIIIRADFAKPADVLGILVHELVHAVLPPDAKHGKVYKAAAQRIGLEGKMRHALPGPVLQERLNALAENLGPLPHAKLNFASLAADKPKKQGTRMLKAECCGEGCGYTIRLAAKWARLGTPLCPISPEHGPLKCDLPDDDDEAEGEEAAEVREVEPV